MTKQIPDLQGVTLIHASAVCTKYNEALIFLGPSGAGKSTICQLLRPFTRMLDDDIIYLFPQGAGRWSVASADGHTSNRSPSEEKLSALEGVPLQAVFRIYQAAEPRLEGLRAMETCRCLTDAFFQLHWQRQQGIMEKKRAFARLGAVARAVPGYRLYFSRSTQTAKMILTEVSRGPHWPGRK